MTETEEHRYHIRTATPADVGKIAKMQLDLEKEELSDYSGVFHINNERITRTPDFYRNQIEDASATLAVVDDITTDKIVGIGLARVSYREDYLPSKLGEILDVWIEPDHRGKGLCAKLVAELVHFFKMNRVLSLTVHYAKEDLEAESLWYRLGFRPILVTAIARLDEVEAAFLAKSTKNGGHNCR